jgi:hypothetical protein
MAFIHELAYFTSSRLICVHSARDRAMGRLKDEGLVNSKTGVHEILSSGPPANGARVPDKPGAGEPRSWEEPKKEARRRPLSPSCILRRSREKAPFALPLSVVTHHHLLHPPQRLPHARRRCRRRRPSFRRFQRRPHSLRWAHHTSTIQSMTEALRNVGEARRVSAALSAAASNCVAIVKFPAHPAESEVLFSTFSFLSFRPLTHD